MSIVYKPEALPAVDYREAMRYMRARGEIIPPELTRAADKLSPHLTPMVCYSVFPVGKSLDGVVIGGAEFRSRSLERALLGCEGAVVFIATVGYAPDRMIARSSPTDALIYQALGAERAEALCDCFSDYIRGLYGEISSRFSPGYGDLSLEYQKDIFRLIPDARRIGVSLTEEQIMIPTKSVSAIIGVKSMKEKKA